MSANSILRDARWRVAGIVLAVFAVAYGGFEFGRMTAGYFIASSLEGKVALRRENAALKEENDALHERATVAEVAQHVDRQAQSEAQRMIGELQAETARQRQELQFYRGLVARQFGSGTLRVQELQVRAEEEERRYRVLITLVQAAARNTVANGSVTFSIEGEEAGAAKTLTLAELEPDGRRQFPFSLRFFQQIEVPIELPLEFQPARLHVEYRLGRNPEPHRQAFAWRVDGNVRTPQL